MLHFDFATKPRSLPQSVGTIQHYAKESEDGAAWRQVHEVEVVVNEDEDSLVSKQQAEQETLIVCRQPADVN
jgi:hypothetical protein